MGIRLTQSSSGSARWNIASSVNNFMGHVDTEGVGYIYIDGAEMVGDGPRINDLEHLLTVVSPIERTWQAAIGNYWNKSVGVDRYYIGMISEIIVYNRDLSEEERSQVDAYLMKKWLSSSPVVAQQVGQASVAAEAELSMALGGSVTVESIVGSGTLRLESGSAVTVSDYAGFDGVVDGLGVLRLSGANSGMPEFVPQSSGLHIYNDTPNGIVMEFSGSEERLFAANLHDGVSPFGVVRSGSGTTHIAGKGSSYSGDTVVESGVLKISGASSVSARYVRFTVDAVRSYGSYPASGHQMSEFELWLGDTKLEYPEGTVATLKTGYHESKQGPVNLIDGDINTKYYNSSKTVGAFAIELPYAVTFDGYRWITANDATARDPMRWRVEGNLISSSNSSDEWFLIDQRDYTRREAEITLDRKSLAGQWFAGGAEEMGGVSDYSAMVVSAPGKLVLERVSEVVGPLFGDGEIELEREAVLGINAFEAGEFSGDISGSGSVVKYGAAHQVLSGVVSCDGAVRVAEGVLEFDGAVVDGVDRLVVGSAGELGGSASVAGSVLLAFEEGGVFSGELEFDGVLYIEGDVTLGVPAGAGYPYSRTILRYESISEESQIVLESAVVVTDGGGLKARVVVGETSARLVVAAEGTMLIVR